MNDDRNDLKRLEDKLMRLAHSSVIARLEVSEQLTEALIEANEHDTPIARNSHVGKLIEAWHKAAGKKDTYNADGG